MMATVVMTPSLTLRGVEVKIKGLVKEDVPPDVPSKGGAKE